MATIPKVEATRGAAPGVPGALPESSSVYLKPGVMFGSVKPVTDLVRPSVFDQTLKNVVPKFKIESSKLETPPPNLQRMSASDQVNILKKDLPLPYGNTGNIMDVLGAAGKALTGSASIDEVVMRMAQKEYKAAIKVVDLESKEIKTFPYIIVNAIQKRYLQRYQVVSTFDDNMLYLFGEQPVSVTFTCAAYDLENHNWARSLENFYKTEANAYTATRARKITYITVDNWLFEGAWIELSPQGSSLEPGITRFGITLILTGVLNLSSQYTEMPTTNRTMSENEQKNVAAADAYAVATQAAAAAAGMALPGALGLRTISPNLLTASNTNPTTPGSNSAVSDFLSQWRNRAGGSFADQHLQKMTGISTVFSSPAVQTKLANAAPESGAVPAGVVASSVTKAPAVTRAVTSAALPSFMQIDPNTLRAAGLSSSIKF